MRQCPNWDSIGHNWIIIRGTWLVWRHYRVCCSCGLTQRLFCIGAKYKGTERNPLWIES